MRLINTHSLQLEEFFFDDGGRPTYAILSHTWGKEEVIFSDMVDLDKARAKAGFAKLEGACSLAASQGYGYIWIDTCCIDKSSSAELSEAINSMYRWYRWADVCYAYLADVHDLNKLEESKWFTRGWTLQELIAPPQVEFYTVDWAYLGERRDPGLLVPISRASLVDEVVLSGILNPQFDISVAKRMYWASKRRTTRKEDEAYCLMGLFGVNMPLLYGEGNKAFIRLQQEIARNTDDQSILAWYCSWSSPDSIQGHESVAFDSCCAPSPRCFAMSGNIAPLPRSHLAGTLGSISLTSLSAEFLAIIGRPKGSLEVILHCQIGPIPGTFPTLHLHRSPDNPQHYTRTVHSGIVSQFSLHRHEALLAHAGIPAPPANPQRNSLGLQPHESFWDSGASPAQHGLMVTSNGDPDAEDKGQTFKVKRVTVSKTFVYYPKEVVVLNSKEREMLSMPIDAFGALTFWLIPLATERSNLAISVQQVLPVELWDRGNHQLIWTPEIMRGAMKPGLETPLTVGVARIHLVGADEARESRNETLKTVVLGFGMCRFSIHHSNKEDNRSHCTVVPWCHLAKGEGVTCLKQHYASRVSSRDAQRHSSLVLDNHAILRASAVPTIISGNSYYFIKLWVTNEVDEVDGTVVSDPSQTQIEVPELGQDVK